MDPLKAQQLTQLSREPAGWDERAYQLAMSGEFQFLYEIEARLIAEGYKSAPRYLSKDPELRSLLWHRLTQFRGQAARRRSE